MQTPTLEEFELPGAQGTTVKFRGELLGESNTRSPNHTGHPNFPYIQPGGDRCGACRWLEVQIYRTVGEAQKYFVYTVGKTSVPREVDRITPVWTDSAFEIIEVLTVRKSGKEPKLPAASARVLASAAQFDDDIRDAYINRAVV